LVLCLAALALVAGPAAGISWGQRAPDFTLLDLSGRPTTLTDLLSRHDAVVLALGTTWSYQFPSWAQKLHRLADRHKDGRVVVAAVFLRDQPKKVRLFAHRHGLTRSDMLLLVDSNGSLMMPYGLREIPRILLLDKAGTVHYDGTVERIDESVNYLLDGKAVPIQKGKPTFTKPSQGN
jgi:peroxiredoxin